MLTEVLKFHDDLSKRLTTAAVQYRTGFRNATGSEPEDEYDVVATIVDDFCVHDQHQCVRHSDLVALLNAVAAVYGLSFSPLEFAWALDDLGYCYYIDRFGHVYWEGLAIPDISTPLDLQLSQDFDNRVAALFPNTESPLWDLMEEWPDPFALGVSELE